MGKDGKRRALEMTEGIPIVCILEYQACGSLDWNVSSKKLSTSAFAGVKCSMPKTALAMNSTVFPENFDTEKPWSKVLAAPRASFKVKNMLLLMCAMVNRRIKYVMYSSVL